MGDNHIASSAKPVRDDAFDITDDEKLKNKERR
jgi:hypothetical protein